MDRHILLTKGTTDLKVTQYSDELYTVNIWDFRYGEPSQLEKLTLSDLQEICNKLSWVIHQEKKEKK